MYASLHIFIENPEREHFARKRRGLHQAGKETEEWKRFQWKVDWELEPFWKRLFYLNYYFANMFIRRNIQSGAKRNNCCFWQNVNILQSIVVFIVRAKGSRQKKRGYCTVRLTISLPPHSGRKSPFSAPLDNPDVSGYQLGIGCQLVKT